MVDRGTNNELLVDPGPETDHSEETNEQERDHPDRSRARSGGDIQHVTHQRQIDDVRRRRMHMGEELQEITLEHPERFVFVGDVMLRHARYDARFGQRNQRLVEQKI